MLTCLLALTVALTAAACSAGGNNFDDDDDSQTSTGEGGGIGFDAGTGGTGLTGDPKTCAEAEQARTYMGCDFWPTVTANNVWSIFDFAVVVANTGENVVDATVTRGGAPVATAQIQPNALETIYLPWVPELKGPDCDECGSATPMPGSVRVVGGAYHLETTFPVTVYQFSALEYVGQGGPPGKDWSSCPGNLPCLLTMGPVGCYSFSNDASLLIPSTAWTGNYRVTSIPGWVNPMNGTPIMGTYIAITGLQDGTTVNIHLSATADIVAGGGLSATGGGQTATTTIGRGEVIEVVSSATSDMSGTWVEATGPVQVIAGIPCRNIPDEQSACDHLEESVFPAETLGQHYVVTRPTGPHGTAAGHYVRIYGNVDGTTLSYPSGQPPNAPTSINAGQVADLGVVNMDFEVEGSAAFAVGTFQQGASVVDPGAQPPDQKGDPAQSLSTAVEQYRTKYVFLAPLDYDVNFVDIVLAAGTQVLVDGAPISAVPEAIGSSGYTVARVQLGPGTNGAHLLEASSPVGIQVAGYGSYTSYYYPGGLDLEAIAPPPAR
jgi:hypothetical protein